MEGKAKTIATRAKADLSRTHWLANLARYWHLHSKPQVGLLHHTHKTAEEIRLATNKKRRVARANKKSGVKK